MSCMSGETCACRATVLSSQLNPKLQEQAGVLPNLKFFSQPLLCVTRPAKCRNVFGICGFLHSADMGSAGSMLNEGHSFRFSRKQILSVLTAAPLLEAG